MPHQGYHAGRVPHQGYHAGRVTHQGYHALPRSWTWPFRPSGTVPPSNTAPLTPPPQLLLHVIMLVLTILASGFIIFLLFKPFIKEGLQVRGGGEAGFPAGGVCEGGDEGLAWLTCVCMPGPCCLLHTDPPLGGRGGGITVCIKPAGFKGKTRQRTRSGTKQHQDNIMIAFTACINADISNTPKNTSYLRQH